MEQVCFPPPAPQCSYDFDFDRFVLGPYTNIFSNCFQNEILRCRSVHAKDILGKDIDID